VLRVDAKLPAFGANHAANLTAPHAPAQGLSSARPVPSQLRFGDPAHALATCAPVELRQHRNRNASALIVFSGVSRVFGRVIPPEALAVLRAVRVPDALVFGGAPFVLFDSHRSLPCLRELAV